MNSRLCMILLGMILVSCSANHTVSNKVYRMMTVERDTIDIARSTYQNTIIVFANGRSCLSCFAPVDEMLSSIIHDSTSCNVVVLMPSGGSILSYRVMLQKVGAYLSFPHNTLYEFQRNSGIVDSLENISLFEQYHVMQTPAILLLGSRKEEPSDFIPYHDLLDSSGLQVTLLARQRLIDYVHNYSSR